MGCSTACWTIGVRGAMERIDKARQAVRVELREFRKCIRDNPARAIGAGVFLLIAARGSVMNHWSLVISAREPWYFFSDLIKDIGPELAVIVVGVLTIDCFNARRQEEQLKRQLILQLASKYGDVTDMAARTLREYVWLDDGTLRGARLY